MHVFFSHAKLSDGLGRESISLNEKPSKFKKRYAIAFMVFGVYLVVVGLMTNDSSMGSSIATKLMRWATISGGIVCMVVGFLMSYLRP